MVKKSLLYGFAVSLVVLTGSAVWTVSARAGYASADYRVVQADGNIEIREYPDLMLASVETRINANGRDGSFMKLFRYISGNNDAEQKIAMTTPVFMEGEDNGKGGQMGFVLPKQVASSGIPNPKASDVNIRKRQGGRFAVIRFAGRMDNEKMKSREKELRSWMESKGFIGAKEAEAASYDPPFTPGPLRRNEVLIRLEKENVQ